MDSRKRDIFISKMLKQFLINYPFKDDEILNDSISKIADFVEFLLNLTEEDS